jgi:hypothetical protein
MTRSEFASVMAYIGLGCGKPLSDAAMEVYLDLLGDLSLEALWVAAKRAVLEHKYYTFPPVAILREFAVEPTRGTEMTPGEAWKIAWGAIGRYDPDIEGSFERAFRRVPPVIFEACLCFGPQAMIAAPKIEVARAQWLTIYEALVSRQRRMKQIPASLQEEISRVAQSAPRLRIAEPASAASQEVAQQLAQRVGQMPADTAADSAGAA